MADARVRARRPPQRLLSCALTRSMEPKGVESDTGLEGGSRVAGNIGSVAAQVLRNNWKSIFLVTEGGYQRQAQSLQAEGLLGHIFGIDFLAKKSI